ncbi:MAG TPA: hypothetical protein VH540_04610 [Ktedonobacterales bacterium]|jgi:hypothetical protein
MIFAEVGWLEAAGQAAGVVLIIELMLLILLTTVLVAGTAYVLYYIHNKVIPLLTRLAPAMEQRLQATDRTSVKVAERVIDLHARTEAVKATVRTLVGRNGHQQLPPGREIPRLEGPTQNGEQRLPGPQDGQRRLANPNEGR